MERNSRFVVGQEAGTSARSNKERGMPRVWLLRLVVATVMIAAGVGSAQTYDATLYPGFLPDPLRLSYVSGGGVDAGNLADAYGYPCAGWIARVPDHVVRVTRPFDYLRIFADGTGDTTLVLHNPATNETFCDDDSHGNGQPELVMTRLAPGEWHIFVGSYWRDEMHPYELTITEFSSRYALGLW